ncbi:hypothetical protein K7432_016771 [Basidiobolus ranarum]|uniref:Uncharacterized protein n=1 Tax=Basidiobolus ranarum TaxID=34480 RepID=A0ABR2WE91_9FUNG
MKQANSLCKEHDHTIADRRNLEKEKANILRQMNQIRSRLKAIVHGRAIEKNDALQKSFNSELREAYDGLSPQVTESKLSIQSVESHIFNLKIIISHHLRMFGSTLATSCLQIASAKGELPSLVERARNLIHGLDSAKNQLEVIGTSIENIFSSRKALLRYYGEIGVELNRIISSAYLHKSRRSNITGSNTWGGECVPLPKLDEWLQNYKSGAQPNWMLYQDIEKLSSSYISFSAALKVLREENSLLERKHIQIENDLLHQKRLLDIKNIESESGLLGISRTLNNIRNQEKHWKDKELSTINISLILEDKKCSPVIPIKTTFFNDSNPTQSVNSPMKIQLGPLERTQTSKAHCKSSRPSSLFSGLSSPPRKKTRSSCPDLRLLTKRLPTTIVDRYNTSRITLEARPNMKPLHRRAYSFDEYIRPTVEKTTSRRAQTSNNSPILSSNRRNFAFLKGRERRHPGRSVSTSPDIRTLRKIASSVLPSPRSPLSSGARSVSSSPSPSPSSIGKLGSKEARRTDLLQQKLTMLSQLRKEMDILERVNSPPASISENNTQEEKRRFQAILRKKREYILRMKDLAKECQSSLELEN